MLSITENIRKSLNSEGFKDRILWVDWVRALAIVAILVIHVSSSYLTDISYQSNFWFIATFFESLSRFGIIAFVMISGYLLMNREYELTDFLNRRLKRVLIPFILWNFIYIFFKINFQNVLGDNYTLSAVLAFIGKAFLDPTIVAIQFWFIYMIVGLYLVAPIISKWIKNSNDREVEYFLVIWLITLLLGFFSVSFLLEKYLIYFSGFIGYFILGYYLAKKESKYLNSRLFGLILFIIGTLITFVGTVYLTYQTGQLDLTFIQLGDLTPNAFLQATGVFIIIKNTDFSSWSVKNWSLNGLIIKISLFSYGIYLLNVLVLRFFEYFGLLSVNTNPIYNIPIFVFLTLIVSLITLMILDKIPGLKYLSGK